MSARLPLESPSLPMANYSSAIAKALEWLGDRYLLAKPINSALRGEAQGQAQARLTSPRRPRSSWDIGSG